MVELLALAHLQVHQGILRTFIAQILTTLLYEDGFAVAEENILIMQLVYHCLCKGTLN